MVQIATLAGKPIIDSTKGSRQSNWWEFGTGGTPGQGRVLMTYADYSSLPDDGLNLELWANDAPFPGLPTVSIPVRVVGAQNYSTAANAPTALGDIVEVILYDFRIDKYNKDFRDTSYNVMTLELNETGTTAQLYPLTMQNPGITEWTWTTLLADTGFASFDPLMSAPAFEPRNVIIDNLDPCAIIDHWEQLLCLVARWDEGTEAWIFSERDVALASNDALITANPLYDDTAQYNIAYQDNGVLPERIQTGHHYVTTTGQTDPYDNRIYYATPFTRPNGAGEHVVMMNNYPALRDTAGGGANEAGLLNNVSTWIGQRFYQAIQSENQGDFLYPDIIPFVCDGRITRIRFEFNAYGRTTRIRLNDPRPFAQGLKPDRAPIFGGLAQFYAGPGVNRSFYIWEQRRQETAYFRIINGVPTGSPNKWQYAVQQVALSGGSWNNIGSTLFPVFNIKEDHNDGIGDEGIGTDIDGTESCMNSPGTLTMLPLMNGSICKGINVLDTETDEYGWWLDEINTFCPECAATGGGVFGPEFGEEFD